MFSQLPDRAPEAAAAQTKLQQLKIDGEKTASEQIEKAYARLAIVVPGEQDGTLSDRESARLLKGVKRNCTRAIKRDKTTEHSNQLPGYLIRGYLRTSNRHTGIDYVKKQKKASQDFKKVAALLETKNDNNAKAMVHRLRADTKVIRALSPNWAPRTLGTSRDGLLMQALREYDLALRLFDEQETQARNDVLYAKALATAEIKQAGRLEAALELLTELERAEPGSPRIFNLRGVIHMRQKQQNLGEAAYREAVRLSQHYDYALWNCAAFCESQSRIGEARYYYELLCQNVPRSALAAKARHRANLIIVEQGQWATIGITDDNAYRKQNLEAVLAASIPQNIKNTKIGKTTEIRQNVSVTTHRTWPAIKHFSGTARVRNTMEEVSISGTFYQPSRREQHVNVQNEVVVTRPLAHELKNACGTIRQMLQAIANFEWDAAQIEEARAIIEHITHALPGIHVTDQVFQDLRALMDVAKFSQEYVALIVNPNLKGRPSQNLSQKFYQKSEAVLALPFRGVFFDHYQLGSADPNVPSAPPPSPGPV